MKASKKDLDMKRRAAMSTHHSGLMLLGLVFVFSIYDVVPAPAANFPYCMSRVAGRIGMVEECNYVSMEQCWASSVGVNGSCAPNWRLEYYRQQRAAEESVARPRTRRRYE